MLLALSPLVWGSAASLQETAANATLGANATALIQPSLTATAADATLGANATALIQPSLIAVAADATISAGAQHIRVASLSETADAATIFAFAGTLRTASLTATAANATFSADATAAVQAGLTATAANATGVITALDAIHASLTATAANAAIGSHATVPAHASLTETAASAALGALVQHNRSASLTAAAANAALSAAAADAIHASLTATAANAAIGALAQHNRVATLTEAAAAATISASLMHNRMASLTATAANAAISALVMHTRVASLTETAAAATFVSDALTAIAAELAASAANAALSANAAAPVTAGLTEIAAPAVLATVITSQILAFAELESTATLVASALNAGANIAVRHFRNNYVQRRVRARMQSRGDPMVLRRVADLAGPAPYLNPPDVSPDVEVNNVYVDGGGQTYFRLAATTAIGRLVSGDRLVVGGLSATDWTVVTMPQTVLTDSDGIPQTDADGNPLFGTPLLYYPDALSSNDMFPVVPVTPVVAGSNAAGTLAQPLSFVFAADQAVYGYTMTYEQATALGWTELDTLAVRLAAWRVDPPPKTNDMVLLNGGEIRSVVQTGRVFRDGVNFMYPVQLR